MNENDMMRHERRASDDGIAGAKDMGRGASFLRLHSSPQIPHLMRLVLMESYY